MDQSYFNGKTALVTGGAIRIGRAICLALARAGANLVVHYRSSRREADDLCGEIEQYGGAAFSVQSDFADDDGCGQLIESAAAAAGGLDMLVNSASVFHKDSLLDLDRHKLRAELRVNLEAPILLMQAFARRGGEGRIVNLLDTRVAGDDISCVPYLLSKKSLEDATRLAALELAPNFTVNAVAPGDVLPPNNGGSGDSAEYARPRPLNSRPTPAAVADSVLFLLATDTITGQVVYVDSGAHLL